jgi:hypothetical protein
MNDIEERLTALETTVQHILEFIHELREYLMSVPPLCPPECPSANPDDERHTMKK